MTFDGLFLREESSDKEARFGAIALLIVALFVVLDIIEDSMSGIELPHLIVEAVIFSISLSVALYLWRSAAARYETDTQVLREQLSVSRSDAVRWRKEASTLIAGLGTAIDLQFERWGLSEAERDIGLLILKGFSHKEIAELRGRSERTVRQQAAALYQKSSLANRAQFSAFFLEDLLRPLEKGDSQSVQGEVGPVVLNIADGGGKAQNGDR